MVVQRVGLQQVDDVKPVGPPGHRVRKAEVKPLSEAASVVIGLQDQVVLEFINLNGSSKVS